MVETEIYIMGYPVRIAYSIHDPSYVEWQIVPMKNRHEHYDLMNVLLRIHYAEFIEGACRENNFYRLYVQSQTAPEAEDIPF